MAVPLLLTALVLLCLAGLTWLALTREHVDETDRFNRARDITNAWADPAPAALAYVPDDETQDRQR
jgi:hypothetical protein